MAFDNSQWSIEWYVCRIRIRIEVSWQLLYIYCEGEMNSCIRGGRNNGGWGSMQAVHLSDAARQWRAIFRTRSGALPPSDLNYCRDSCSRHADSLLTRWSFPATTLTLHSILHTLLLLQFRSYQFIIFLYCLIWSKPEGVPTDLVEQKINTEFFIAKRSEVPEFFSELSQISLVIKSLTNCKTANEIFA